MYEVDIAIYKDDHGTWRPTYETLYAGRFAQAQDAIDHMTAETKRAFADTQPPCKNEPAYAFEGLVYDENRLNRANRPTVIATYVFPQPNSVILKRDL